MVISAVNRYIASVLTVLLAVISSAAWSATYDVTSSSCSGPGSFQEAVAAANANAGPDTVAFQIDVVGVNNGECGRLGADPSDAYMAQVTDELIIEGNDHSITGKSCHWRIRNSGCLALHR